jgi:hypothetical protein
VSDLAVRRRGQVDPFIITPAIRMTMRDVVWKDGALTGGRLELTGAPSIIDATVVPTQRFDIQAARVGIEAAGRPARPARVAISADLPAGGRLEARGTTALPSAVSDLQVTLANIDLRRMRPYLPAASPVTLERGRLEATLRVRHDSTADLRVSGTGAALGVVLFRRGQAEPFVSHRRLDIAVQDLMLQAGQLAVGRLELTGAPTIVDASVSPPQRFAFTSLHLVAENATWPARGPARVTLTAEVGDSIARIRGIMNPGTLATDVRTEFRDIDVGALRGYLPRDAAVTVDRGMLSGGFDLLHDPATGTRIDGDGTLRDLGLVRQGRREPFLTASRLHATVKNLVLHERISLEELSAAGDTTLVDWTLAPPQRLRLTEVRLVAARLGWPARAAVPVRLTAALPGAGTISANGSVDPERREAALQVRIADAAVTPYRRHLPFSGRVRGRAAAQLRVAASFGQDPRVRVAGDVTVSRFSLGPIEEPPIRIASVTATGIDARWPARQIGIARVVLRGPAVLVERDPDGRFPLARMLRPPSQPLEAPRRRDDPSRTGFSIRQLLAEDGDVRFADQASVPAYFEQASRIVMAIEGLTNAPGEQARLQLEGVVGPHGALDLSGDIAPFDEPFRLDLSGELSEFPVPRVNPYMQRFLDWVARTGTLTTRVHYRVVGDRLEASHDLVVRGLTVARPGAEASGRVGMPLELAVALLKDTRGDIRLSLPISGTIGAPQFNLGAVIAANVRNLLASVVTAPFHGIGRVFRRGDAIETVQIDPVEFEPGTTNLTPGARTQLERLARLLSESPRLRLTLEPVITTRDVLALKTHDVMARIQATQRQEGLANFQDSAARLFSREFPRQKTPADAGQIVARLRENAAEPVDATRQLALRRLEAVRGLLMITEQVGADRLVAVLRGQVGVSGPARIEFEPIS